MPGLFVARIAPDNPRRESLRAIFGDAPIPLDSPYAAPFLRFVDEKPEAYLVHLPGLDAPTRGRLARWMAGELGIDRDEAARLIDDPECKVPLYADGIVVELGRHAFAPGGGS